MSRFDPQDPFAFVQSAHLQAAETREAAVQLFRQSVTQVEIEVFSYCNRRCWFCPNSFIDRHSAVEYMREPLYLAVLDQLGDLGYEGLISYSRYNEPLADRIILTRIAQARRCVPRARLHTNTNGDYLTPVYLEALAAAGLSSLNIQVYLGNDDRYDHERARARLIAIVDKLALAARITRDDPDDWLEATATAHGLHIRIYARNFEHNGCDRGGTVPVPAPVPRTSPCLSPFYHVYIDFNGKIMPCCNLRSDVAAHAETVVGDLNDTADLVSIYAGATLAGWRRHLIGFAPKAGVCATCTFAQFPDTPANRAACGQW